MLCPRSRSLSTNWPFAFNDLISTWAAVRLFVQVSERRFERRIKDATPLPFSLLAVNVTNKFVSRQNLLFVSHVVPSFSPNSLRGLNIAPAPLFTQ